MAAENVADIQKGETQVIISTERHGIVIEAAMEIGSLCELLRRHEGVTPFAIRGVSARIEDLAMMIAEGLDEEKAHTADLARAIRRS